MQKNYPPIRALLTLLVIMFVGLTAKATTVEMSTFTAISADMDAVASYECAKGNGTSTPIINSGQIRLYQNASGIGGGTITISVKEEYILTDVTIGSSMATKIAYTIGDDTEKSTTVSLAANGKYEVNAINSNAITFYCMGTSSSSRLYVNYLSVTYESNSTDPSMSVSPAELNFSAVTGMASEAQTVMLRLANMEASTVSYALTGNDFAVTEVSDTEYSVVFNAPATAGDSKGTLTFSTSVEGVDPVTVALKGTATEPVKEGDIVEHFNSTTITSNAYNSGSNYSTPGNSDGHDFTWTASGSVYLGKDFVRFASGSAAGSLTSSDFLAEIPNGTSFTVKVYIAKWGTDGVSFTVTYGGESRTYTSLEKSITSSGSYNADDFGVVECEFTKTESDDFTIATASGKRVLIDKVEIFYEKGPSLSVTPASYDFGTHYVGSAAVEWTLSDITATPSDFSGEVAYTYALSGEGFAFDNDVAPTCVRFSPDTEGSFSGTLTVTAACGEETASASVALTAIVESVPVPSMTASTDALEFKTPIGTTMAKEVTLTVANLSSAVSYDLSGTDADLFTVAAAADVYTVTFAAPVTIGTYSATLTFSADGVDPVVVSLTGVAQEMPSELKERFNSTTVTQNAYNTTNGFQTAGYDFTWEMTGKAYTGATFVKFGSSSETGTLTSSDLLAAIPVGSEFTVVVYAADWKSSATADPENARLQVTYNGVSQDDALQDAVPAGQSYAASDFEHPVRFTFTKVDGVNDISFTTASGGGKRLVIDDIVVEFAAVSVVSTFPEADATDVEVLETSRMSITFNKAVASADATKITVAPEDWTVAVTETSMLRAAADRCVEVVEVNGNTVVFHVNSWNTCLATYNQEYSVTFAGGAVTFADGASSSSYAWSFTTQDIGTGINGVEAVKSLLYDGRQVVAAGNDAIEVYNLAGARVAARRGSVDLTDLASGVYVVRCGSEVMKVVKR